MPIVETVSGIAAAFLLFSAPILAGNISLLVFKFSSIGTNG